MTPDYPVTRLQAAKCLRRGERLEVDIKGESTVQVMLAWETFPKGFRARLWTRAGVLWLKLTWKQSLGFIRRNYARNYW
jgi:hypothetical protein